MRKVSILLLAILGFVYTAAAQLANPYTNAATTGTTINLLATINSSNQAVLATTSNTNVPTYVVVGGAGTSGVAQLAVLGQASCVMDSTIASAAGGYFVVASTTTAGDCHPESAAPADGTWVVGYLAVGSTTSGSSALVDVRGFFYGTSDGVTAASSAGAAKQVCVSGGATKSCSYIDFPQVLDIPAANCNNTSAGAGWSIGSGGTVSCRAGTNDFGGFISITDTSTTFATFQIEIPEDWDSTANPYIRFQIASTDTTSGDTIIPSIEVACYKGDGTTTDDVAPNAAHSLSTITLNATANQFWSTANVQLNATDMTGCAAGSLMQITVGRATDTATNAEFYSATVTFPRLLTVGAN